MQSVEHTLCKTVWEEGDGLGILWEAPLGDSFIQQVFMESVPGVVLGTRIAVADGANDAPGTLLSFGQKGMKAIRCHPLYCRHWSKCWACNTSFNPHNNPCWGGCRIIILEMRKQAEKGRINGPR